MKQRETFKVKLTDVWPRQHHSSMKSVTYAPVVIQSQEVLYSLDWLCHKLSGEMYTLWISLQFCIRHFHVSPDADKFTQLKRNKRFDNFIMLVGV